MAGAGQLVRAGGAAVRDRPLAAWGHVGAAHGRAAALVAGPAGAVATLVSAGCGPGAAAARCELSASTVQRWLDRAGRHGAATRPSGSSRGAHQRAARDRWACGRGCGAGATRVVLLLTDSVSGVVWPPVVVDRGGRRAPVAAAVCARSRGGAGPGRPVGRDQRWGERAGAYLRQHLSWVNHQRCVWHLWRGLGGELAAQAAAAARTLTGRAAARLRQQTRTELAALVRAVFDAASEAAAWEAHARLAAHPRGPGLATALRDHVAAALVYRRQVPGGAPAGGPRMVLAGLPLAPGPRAQRGRARARLERTALRLGDLPQLHPRARKERTAAQISVPGPVPARRGGGAPGRSQLSRRLGGVTPAPAGGWPPGAARFPGQPRPTLLPHQQAPTRSRTESPAATPGRL